MGARPLHRTIDDQIKKPLSKEILFGKLVNGGIVEIDTNEDQFVFNFINVLDATSDKIAETVDDENS